MIFPTLFLRAALNRGVASEGADRVARERASMSWIGKQCPAETTGANSPDRSVRHSEPSNGRVAPWTGGTYSPGVNSNGYCAWLRCTATLARRWAIRMLVRKTMTISRRL